MCDFQLQMEISRSLGVDFGEARVGIAVSDDLNMMAHPLETITVKTTKVIPRIRQLVAEKRVTTLVVGMPRNMDGSFGPAAEKARVFIDALRQAVPCPVIPWDERMTTMSAQRSLREAGRNSRQQRSVVDQAAAQIILQSWMDSQALLSELPEL